MEETSEEPCWGAVDHAFGVNRSLNHGAVCNGRQVIAMKDFDSHQELCFDVNQLARDLGTSSFDQQCSSLKQSGKVDLGIGFEEGYDEKMDGTAGWNESKGSGRSYGASMGSPLVSHRKLSTIRTSMWKGRSFDSTGTDGVSSSQSSATSGMSSQPVSVTGYGQPDFSVPMALDFGGSFQEDTASETSSVSVPRAASGNLAGDPRWSGDMCVERQAQAYRSAASGATAAAVWSGILPPRNTKGSAFSCKVFLGGVPWDITESDLQAAFGMFGNPKIEWPAAHDKSSRNVKGHLYLIFDTEKSVKQLLGSCNYDFNQGHHNWYFKVASKRMRVKEVQVIPWQLADASYVRNGCMTTFGTKTVFVGSLHGMLTAEGLAKVLDDLFQGVVAATIDTDKYKYPIGSGRVTFNSNESYMKALRAVFVDLRTPKFNKKIQIDPFLEDSACSICSTQLGPYFCRDLQCFSYFCHACWQWQHSANNIGHHIPLMRNPRT